MHTSMATIHGHTTTKEMQHLQEHLKTMSKYSAHYKTQIVKCIILLQCGFFSIKFWALHEGYLLNSNTVVISG